MHPCNYIVTNSPLDSCLNQGFNIVDLFFWILLLALLYWILIYKTVRRILTKSVRMLTKMAYAPQKSDLKTGCTQTCKQCSLYKSQITHKCAYVNQHFTPPWTSAFLTINSQCKSPHECWSNISMALACDCSYVTLRWIMASGGKRTKKRNFSDTDIEKLRGGGAKKHISPIWWPQQRDHQ